MEFIHIPTKLNYSEGENPNTVVLTVEPCQGGYGTTLGNAVRRVLLSSMPGAAVTAIKIKGVDHEFSSIPKVKEDVIQIILNFKRLRLKVTSDEEVRLKLTAKGEKVVTAGDIEANSAVEIMNKDLEICTLTDKNAEVEIEIFVDQGIGYTPTEAREKEKLEVGVISIDSIYTPVKNVGYKVESARVGEMTNYDKLILTVETDGTITPQDAIKQSADLLMKLFTLFLSGEDYNADEIVAEEEIKEDEVVEVKE